MKHTDPCVYATPRIVLDGEKFKAENPCTCGADEFDEMQEALALASRYLSGFAIPHAQVAEAVKGALEKANRFKSKSEAAA